MPEIIKTYRQSLPATRFIGTKYGDEDRIGGGYGHLWMDWIQSERFVQLYGQVGADNALQEEDADATVGLMRAKEGEPFEYWIGIFTQAGTQVPEGFAFVDFGPTEIGVCWLKGKDPDIYMTEMDCLDKLTQDGYQTATDDQGAFWFYERYADPRFLQPDEQGEIILDICAFVKPAA
jgi:predicted transcriptional regulator YdeE